MREIRADLDTALSLFKRLDDGETSFLFESVAGAEKWARYSFMGRGARAVFRARGQAVEWTEAGRTQRLQIEGDPLDYLRDKLAAIDAVIPETGGDLPPFLGGAVGFVSYDWVRFVEKIPDDESGRDRFAGSLVHLSGDRGDPRQCAPHGASWCVTSRFGPVTITRAIYEAAVADVDAVVQKLREPLPVEAEREALRAPMDWRGPRPANRSTRS